jgi:hypothetical protein
MNVREDEMAHAAIVATNRKRLLVGSAVRWKKQGELPRA